MSVFNQESFNQFILENNIVGFFETAIKLKSGRMSTWYANWRNISEDAYLTDKLTDFILQFIQDNNFSPDCFYGIPEGATKTALITQFKWAKNKNNFSPGSSMLPMGRGKPKEHGAEKDKFFVGAPAGKVIVIEDVTTTGGSLLSQLETLKNMGVDILAALALFNRMEKRDDGKSVQEKVEEMGIKYLCMSNANEILPLLVKQNNSAPELVQSLKEYFEKYGLESLNL